MSEPADQLPTSPALAAPPPPAAPAASPPATPATSSVPAHTYPSKLTPPPPPAPTAPTPTVKRIKRPAPKPEDRRDFFSEAMRETLAPLSGLLQRKINPILAALEAIPDEAERLSRLPLPSILDQPQQRTIPLPVEPDSPAARYLRPPGAAPPGQFESLCTNCAKCVEACPAQAIKIHPRGAVGDGFPYIIPTEQPCVVCSSLACMPACPTGALKLVDRLQIKIGTARVDIHQCLRDHGEDCRLCVEACPITGDGAPGTDGARMDAIFIHAESGRVRVRKNICVGCGLCESRCPTSPPAITILPYSPPIDPIIA